MLEYSKNPTALWVTGTVTTLVGFYLLYHLVFGHYGGTIFKSFTKKHWWQYFITAIIIACGLFMVCIARREKIIFDKDEGLMKREKTFCCFFNCCIRRKSYDLKEVQNIRSFKKGHEGINFYDLHYSLHAEFNTE